MKPYIILPVEWIEKEIALYGERIIEYNDKDYYMAKIMLLYKLLDEFAILNKTYETKKESDASKGRGSRDLRKVQVPRPR